VGIALDQHKHKPKPIHKHKPKPIQNWCRASCWRCSIEMRRPQTHSLVKGSNPLACKGSASHIRARIKRTGNVVLLLATALPNKLTDEHEIVRSPSEETNQHEQKQKKGCLRCCQGYVGPRLISTRIVYYAITVDQSSGLLGKKDKIMMRIARRRRRRRFSRMKSTNCVRRKKRADCVRLVEVESRLCEAHA
jgi:hypothetical protein